MYQISYYLVQTKSRDVFYKVKKMYPFIASFVGQLFISMQNALQHGRVQSLTSVLATVVYANLFDGIVKVTLILSLMLG